MADAGVAAGARAAGGCRGHDTCTPRATIAHLAARVPHPQPTEERRRLPPHQHWETTSFWGTWRWRTGRHLEA